jgi:hypothetical protein
MSYTNGLDNPELYFSTKLYTGNGGTNAITGVGFQPDWVWIKDRDTSQHHRLADVVRSVKKNLKSDQTDAENTTDSNNGLQSFDSDGFTLTQDSNDHGYNASGSSQVSWNWKAGGSASSNSDGSITSTVSSNTTAGFSIVSYTGTGSNATIGHGLGSVPAWIITKTRSTTQPWRVYHKALGETFGMILNDSSVKDDDNTAWNDTAPTSSVFSVGTSANTNGSGSTFIAYCFTEKKGYSKFGSYRGNGNADGTFIFTGFRPAFVIIKNSSRSSENWNLIDNKRDGFNGSNENLAPNLSGTESSGNNRWDILSNGFKCRDTNNEVNNSSDTYIYMAFAESPFVNSNGVPNNAR